MKLKSQTPLVVWIQLPPEFVSSIIIVQAVALSFDFDARVCHGWLYASNWQQQIDLIGEPNILTRSRLWIQHWLNWNKEMKWFQGGNSVDFWLANGRKYWQIKHSWRPLLEWQPLFLVMKNKTTTNSGQAQLPFGL